MFLFFYVVFIIIFLFIMSFMAYEEKIFCGLFDCYKKIVFNKELFFSGVSAIGSSVAFLTFAYDIINKILEKKRET